MTTSPATLTLEAALAEYRRLYGRPRAMAWLRHALLRDIEAQRLMDASSEQVNGDTHWTRLGAEARRQAEEVLAIDAAARKAAE